MNGKVYQGEYRNECFAPDCKVYTVSEAVRLIGVESHVLRYWEEELKISIERTSQGHRVYSQENVALFCRVKELREEGLQLKAIRRVLEQAEERDTGKPEFREFCNSSGSMTADGADASGAAPEEGMDYEIIPTEEPAGSLEQFVAVLKQMLEEVVQEQNEKLKQDLEECIQEKMEELYLQYFQVMQEAAVSKEDEKNGEGIIRKILHRLLRR